MNSRTSFPFLATTGIVLVLLVACGGAPVAPGPAASPAIASRPSSAPTASAFASTPAPTAVRPAPTLDAEAALMATLMAQPAPPPDKRSVATIDTDSPFAAALGAGALWVTNVDDNTLARIDLHTNRVVATIRLGARGGTYGSPRAVVGAGTDVWATDSADHTIVRIDPSTNRVVTTIPLGVEPDEMAVDGTTIWVTSLVNDHLLRIDAQTRKVVARLDMHTATHVVVSHGSLWVVNHRDDRITRVDPRTNRVVATIALGHGPSERCGFCVQHIAVDARGIWVPENLGDQLARIDPTTNQVVATLPVQGEPIGIAVRADGVWVGTGVGTVVRVDPRASRVTETVAVGTGVIWTLEASGNELWVVLTDQKQVVRFVPSR